MKFLKVVFYKTSNKNFKFFKLLVRFNTFFLSLSVVSNVTESLEMDMDFSDLSLLAY